MEAIRRRRIFLRSFSLPESDSDTPDGMTYVDETLEPADEFLDQLMALVIVETQETSVKDPHIEQPEGAPRAAASKGSRLECF